ncbi:unnamed protein product [Litomosoides sigmodontis]|uniref:RING-type domain-containing protein n=1 Tax=Litomosoides sigmodontis TaxID=42156 RepID=A0A3P6U6D7_LITSI|nr:unnamed protein product [Litomosoides sigmodontis]
MASRPQCHICWDVLYLNRCSATRCGHTFHLPCIMRWLRNSETCPVCRKRATQADLIQQLFFEMEEERSCTSSFKIPYELQNALDDLRREKQNAITAVNKANFYFATNLLLRERISNLEITSRHNMQKIGYLERMIIRQLGMENQLQKQLRAAALQIKEAMETVEMQEKKSETMSKMISELTKDLNENRRLNLVLRKKLAYPVVNAAHEFDGRRFEGRVASRY